VLIHNQGIVQGYYRLHNSRVYVTFWDGRVNELDFTTRYYRTTNGFGIGSTIPLGPCYRTATNLCEHRWHGFVWNAWKKETSCHCWFKATKPLKPASAIFIRNGHVSQIYLAQKFVD
jgi:prepilin-type processing-associated H-X9-DG protein